VSDEKKYTECEVVRRERDAFERGCWTVLRHQRDGGSWPGSLPLAAERYPFPKVTRPRVVRDPHTTEFNWSTAPRADLKEGHLRVVSVTRLGMRTHESLANVHVTDERVKVWADLLANPTEEVEK
jgi:hypothetical protein